MSYDIEKRVTTSVNSVYADHADNSSYLDTETIPSRDAYNALLVDSSVPHYGAYTGQPAQGFINYENSYTNSPLAATDSVRIAPYAVPNPGYTRYAEYKTIPESHRSIDFKYWLANLSSDLGALAGAACGSVSAWKHADSVGTHIDNVDTVNTKELSFSQVKVEPKAEIAVPPELLGKTSAKPVLSKSKPLEDQLLKWVGRLPPLRSKAIKVALESAENFSPKVVPALRAGAAGGITGGLVGYALGYIVGDIADLCGDAIVSGYKLLTGNNDNTTTYVDRSSSL